MIKPSYKRRYLSMKVENNDNYIQDEQIRIEIVSKKPLLSKSAEKQNQIAKLTDEMAFDTVYKEYKDKIITNKFEDFTQYKLVFRHKNLLPQEIRELLSKCYSNYYLRYNWIKDYIKK